MSDLLELAERCEAATGPDRDLDIAIWRFVDPKADKLWAEGKRPLHWLHCYTSSLDAALALVPEQAEYNIHRYQRDKGNGRRFSANITHWPEPPISLPMDTVWYGKGRSSALALTAAALRARAASAPSLNAEIAGMGDPS